MRYDDRIMIRWLYIIYHQLMASNCSHAPASRSSLAIHTQWSSCGPPTLDEDDNEAVDDGSGETNAVTP